MGPSGDGGPSSASSSEACPSTPAARVDANSRYGTPPMRPSRSCTERKCCPPAPRSSHDHRCLVAGVDRHERRVHGDERLACDRRRLQAARSSGGTSPSPRRSRPSPALGLGRLEGDRPEQAIGERAPGSCANPGTRAVEGCFAEGHPQLEREQLIELQALAGRRERPFVSREADVAQVARSYERGPRRRRSRLASDRRSGRVARGAMEQLTDRPAWSALGGRMHGGDAPCERDRQRRPEELDLLG